MSSFPGDCPETSTLEVLVGGEVCVGLLGAGPRFGIAGLLARSVELGGARLGLVGGAFFSVGGDRSGLTDVLCSVGGVRLGLVGGVFFSVGRSGGGSVGIGGF